MSAIFAPILSLVGALIIVVTGVIKLRDRRQADMLEATTTWRQIAEANAAKIVQLNSDIADRDKEIAMLRARANFLWSFILSKPEFTIVKDPGT